MSVMLTPKQQKEVKRAAVLASLPDRDCLLNAAQVAVLLSFGVRTLWRQVRLGKFPQPALRATRKLIRWSSRQVQEYLDNLLEPAASA